MVTILKVDPGSYMSVAARFRRTSAGAEPNLLASNVGAFAIASTAPVCVSMTIAVAPFAPQLRTVLTRISSAAAWIS